MPSFRLETLAGHSLHYRASLRVNSLFRPRVCEESTRKELGEQETADPNLRTGGRRTKRTLAGF
jgi:hypothetical protein